MMPLGARGKSGDRSPASTSVAFIVPERALARDTNLLALALDAANVDLQRERAGFVPTFRLLACPANMNDVALCIRRLKPPLRAQFVSKVEHLIAIIVAIVRGADGLREAAADAATVSAASGPVSVVLDNGDRLMGAQIVDGEESRARGIGVEVCGAGMRHRVGVRHRETSDFGVNEIIEPER